MICVKVLSLKKTPFSLRILWVKVNFVELVVVVILLLISKSSRIPVYFYCDNQLLFEVSLHFYIFLIDENK